MKQDLSACSRHPYDFVLDVDACVHALGRIGDRLTMSGEAVLRLINDGRTVCLSSPFKNFQNRGRFLFYSPLDSDFFVAVIAISDVSRKGLLVTVLTREQYEQDVGGELNVGTMKRAARMALIPKEYRAWILKTCPPDELAVSVSGKFKNIRLNVEYWDEESGRESIFLSNLPVGADVLMSAPIRELLEIEDFSSWLLERLKRKGIPLDRIISFYLIKGAGERIELVV